MIGPAVNPASRIEGLTREVSRPIPVSEAFAAVHGGTFGEVGAFTFKGIEAQPNVYAPSA